MANLRTNNLSGEQGQNAYRGSVFFDGTGDKLSVPNSADVRLGSNDFTIEAWVKFGNVAGSWDAIMGMWDSSNSRRTFNLQRYKSAGAGNDGYLYLYVDTDGTSSDTSAGGGNLTLNEWHHVAGVRDGNTLRVYQNGVQVGTASFSGTILNNTTDALFIGDVESDDSNNMNGFISNVRLVNGTCLYPNGTTFTPPQHELTLVPNTVLLACQDSDDVTQEATGKTITAAGNLTDAAYVRMQPKVIPPYGVDAGNAFGGPIQQSSQGYMYFPTGRTEERGRGRAIWGGGNTPSNTNTMDFLQIKSGGKAIDFGDVTVSRNELRACGSSTRGVWAGGRDPSVTDVMDFVEITTTANAVDFGNLTVARAAVAAVSNSTRGVFIAGFAPSNTNHIDYITIATAGNATDFGDTLGTYQAQARAMSPTRGLAAGNYGASNLIEFITIATTGNSTDFGDRTVAAYSATGTSDNTRGVFAGGDGPTTNVIDFVTIATTGNATDFGDLTVANGSSFAATSDSIIGCIGGGASASDTIEKIIIQTTGNAVNFGDLFEGRNQVGATSDSHGGLS